MQPRHVALPVRARTARRLLRAGLLLALFALGPASARPLSGAERFPAGPGLSHGPLVGAVGPDRARIWARVEGVSPQSYSMSVRYGEVGDPVGILSSPLVVTDAVDFTGTIELVGLSAATLHWYRILIDGSPVAGSDGSFATLPPDGEPGVLRFGIGSCNDHLQMPYPIFSAIASESLDFLLHLGDIIYADRSPAATTKAEFEARYRLNLAEPSWRALARDLPSFMIWDDHEIENDWAGGQTGLYLEARPAFEEYVARHNPEPRLPGELYYDFSAGDVDFFVLDTRSHRDPAVPTMLGVTQKAELEQWLSESTATFKIVVSSVQWSFLAQNDDTWFGYPVERAEVFDYVRDHRIRGVVLLSGDRHWIGIFRHAGTAPYVLYELSSSPFGASVGTAPAPDPETLFLSDSGRAYITVAADTLTEPAILDVRVRDEAGSELYQLTITEDDIVIPEIFADGFESGDTSAWSSTIP